jgi:PAS domain S-box-containing protein
MEEYVASQGTAAESAPIDPPAANQGAEHQRAEHQRAEHQRAEHKGAEHWLAAIVESSEDAILSKGLDGIVTTWNRAAERLFGYPAAEAIGRSITMLIPPERLDEEVAILDRIRRGERVDHFETVSRRKDGSLVPISLMVSPISDDAGRIVGCSTIARDITEQKRREAQIALLAREAEHRTRNLLALVQATVQLARGETPADLKAAIDGRLRALAGSHALLAQSRWAGADLRALLTAELAVYGEGDAVRVALDGPDLMLAPDKAEAMAMALHELVTNSIKYGALSVPAGRLHVAWHTDAMSRFVFRWSESGGPPVTPPTHQGFGTSMLEGMISNQLGGEVTFAWRPEGVVCEIGFGM